MIYNNPLSFKIFHWHTMFEGIVSGFLGFFNGMVSIYVSEIVIYCWILRFKTFSMKYNMLLLIKTFHWHTMFEGIVSGFWFFSMVWLQFTFLRIFLLNSIFHDTYSDILYFSIAQIFVDFLICIHRGKKKKVYAEVVFNWL